MSDSSASSRIVPDVDQSLGAQRLRHHSPRPRLWPLWLMIIVLLAALAALTGGAWLERERLLGELERVSGEVSNLHARLASGDSGVQDKLTLVQAQLSTLFQEQEQLSMRFNATREELLNLIPASDDMVSADAIESLLAQVKKQEEAAGLRGDQLTALSESLAALERAADSEHQQLSDDLATLEDTTARRLERQANTDDERLANLNDSLETLAADVTAFSQRLETLESDIRQVRQSQLAFSAQLEMLR